MTYSQSNEAHLHLAVALTSPSCANVEDLRKAATIWLDNTRITSDDIIELLARMASSNFLLRGAYYEKVVENARFRGELLATRDRIPDIPSLEEQWKAFNAEKVNAPPTTQQ
jgi:hypothetical protein